jgi:intracellular sulfur oxidation DsrE/DsrF family protein
MKKLFPLIVLFVLTACGSRKTQPSALEINNQKFEGAVAGRENYYAIYQLDTDDPKVVEKAFRNINNVLEDPRLIGKLKIELVAFSNGTKVMLKGSPYEAELKALLQKGAIIVQCNNSLKEQGLSSNQLYKFIGVVPSGNGELIIRNAEGWAVIKP